MKKRRDRDRSRDKSRDRDLKHRRRGRDHSKERDGGKAGGKGGGKAAKVKRDYDEEEKGYDSDADERDRRVKEREEDLKVFHGDFTQNYTFEGLYKVKQIPKMGGLVQISIGKSSQCNLILFLVLMLFCLCIHY